jgi:hypothetical protein
MITESLLNLIGCPGLLSVSGGWTRIASSLTVALGYLSLGQMKQVARIFRYLRDPYGRAKLANFVRGVFVPKGRGRDEEAVGVSDLPGFWEQAHVDQKPFGSPDHTPKKLLIDSMFRMSCRIRINTFST